MASDHCATHANPGTMWLGFIQEYKDQEEVEIIGGTILLKKKLKWAGKSWIVFPSSQRMSPKIFMNYKGKDSNFTVEKPGRHHFNRVIKVNITNNKAYALHIKHNP